MLKVVIVDDEMMIRVGLQACITWEDYGCQVAAACESAAEAIAFFENVVPDIVFTDIMMPGMNGLELLEYIRKNMPRTKVIVLSCLNEIDYVKKAIRMGAEDYILKLSFTQDTMRELLVKLTKSIEEERSEEEKNEFDSEVHSFDKEEGFRMLLAGSQTIQEREDLLDRLGYHYDPFCSYQVGCFLIDCFKSEDYVQHDDLHMMRYGLQNMIKEYFAKFSEFDLSFIRKNELLIIFKGMPLLDHLGKIEDVLNVLNQALKTHFNLTLSFGISEQIQKRCQIPEQYQKAKELAYLRFFDGNGTFHDHEMELKETFVTKRSIQKQIQEAIFCQEEKQLQQLIEQWFFIMRTYKRFDQIENIRRSVIETWYYISGYSVSEDTELQDFDELYATDVFWDAENLEQLQAAFQKGIKILLEYLKVNKAMNPDINRLLTYLESHVEENISLEQAAAFCMLGKSQFCILFKKATGDTFINYFNRLKMKLAYKLLVRENMQVQEVAYHIGMRDISYFSRMFKKYYRMSPSDAKNGKSDKFEI